MTFTYAKFPESNVESIWGTIFRPATPQATLVTLHMLSASAPPRRLDASGIPTTGNNREQTTIFRPATPPATLGSLHMLSASALPATTRREEPNGVRDISCVHLVEEKSGLLRSTGKTGQKLVIVLAPFTPPLSPRRFLFRGISKITSDVSGHSTGRLVSTRNPRRRRQLRSGHDGVISIREKSPRKASQEKLAAES